MYVYVHTYIYTYVYIYTYICNVFIDIHSKLDLFIKIKIIKVISMCR